MLVTEQSSSDACWIVLFPADRSADYVAERYRSHPETRVLLIDGEPTRLRTQGVQASWVSERRQALLQKGIRESEIQILDSQARNEWDRVRKLREWFIAYPDTEVVALCDRFHSRHLRIILDHVLGPDAGRVRITGLPDRRYDETNWWQSKEGVIGWWDAFSRLAFVALVGEGDPPEPILDADTYERALP
jgi:hypothetical protein